MASQAQQQACDNQVTQSSAEQYPTVSLSTNPGHDTGYWDTLVVLIYLSMSIGAHWFIF